MHTLQKIVLATLVFAASPTRAAAEPFAPPSEAELREVRDRIAEMKRDPRGPYVRLRWFCSDGTTHAPAGSPCRERGGGVQHAELSPAAQRLADLGFHVGTVLQSLDYAEFEDADRDFYRLKELVLQDYLFAVDDGWVLRRGRYYRGARQIEDEERKGRFLLERRLSDPDWIRAHFLLAVRLTAAVPHDGPRGGDETQRIRGLATELADIDARYQNLRVKIHSLPSSDDLGTVESLLRVAADGAARDRLLALRDVLSRLYATGEIVARLAALAPRLPLPLREQTQALVAAVKRDDRSGSLANAATVVLALRKEASSSTDGALNLLLLDVSLLAQQQALALAELPHPITPPDRVVQLQRLLPVIGLATGSGLLSFREHDALRDEIERLVARESVTAKEYWRALGYLSRALDWGVATARMLFSPVLERYAPIEARTNGFIDGLVRGSPLLALSSRLDLLIDDASTVLGQTHELFGEEISHGLRGLNPGVAQRVLTIHRRDGDDTAWDSGHIHVVPETIPEMHPAAGVLTLDAGNLLSHVQLLARGIGIPNAAVSSALLDTLESWAGREVFYAVSPMGVVHLKDPTTLSEAERGLVEHGRRVEQTRVALDTSRLRLDREAPIPLEELRAVDAGVVVGPKAAKLGQLHHEFPDQVAPGVALPFGLYVRHVDRQFEASEQTVRERIGAAYARAAALRSGGRAESEIDAFMFEELAQIRRAILELDWIPDVRAEIERAMDTAFDGDLASGVFVRSDTNIEDLPQFSGAGLNLTVPHQRTAEAILESIKRVWTSPFSERAYLWRKQVLQDTGDIYPSVLLLRSVPSVKSGVLITSGLQLGGADDLTIVTGEGVGAAVDGGDAETLLVTRDGRLRLLSQAKASQRKTLRQDGSGGIVWEPTSKGDALLSNEDVRQLRAVVDKWTARRGVEDQGRIWDMEFGFAGGKLWLFQIRPFVRYRNSTLLEALGSLDAGVLKNGTRRVALRGPS